MRPSSPTPFETVLMRTAASGADRTDGEKDGAERLSPAVGSAPWYVPATPEGMAAGGNGGYWAAGDRYADTIPAEEQAMHTPMPLSTDPHDIAQELDLANCPSVGGLVARRRRFARENHPDTARPALRANATERMMIANRLVDMEIARRRAAEGR